METIDKQLQELRNLIIEHNENSKLRYLQLEKVEHEIERLEAVLFGNGKEGIKDKLARIEYQLNVLSWAAKIGVGALLTSIAMSLWNMLTK